MNFHPTPVRKHPPLLVFTVALMALLLVALADFVSHREMGFFVFYFLPITIAAWGLSGRAGVLFAVLAIALWLGDDIALFSGKGIHLHYSTWFYELWNAAVRFAAFIIIALLVTWNRCKLEDERRLRGELIRAAGQVDQLTNLLPVCTCCRKVRDDDGRWQPFETYLKTHTQTGVDDRICPECGEKLRRATREATAH